MKNKNKIAVFLVCVFSVGLGIIFFKNNIESHPYVSAMADNINSVPRYYVATACCEDELINLVNDPMVSDIILGRDIEVSSPITISRPLTISGRENSLYLSDSFNGEYLAEISSNDEVRFSDVLFNGGGILNNSSSRIEILNCQIKGSSSYAINSKSGSVIVKNTSICENISPNGVIFNGGLMILDSSSVTENIVLYETPSLAVISSPKDSLIYINNSTIAKNITEYPGGVLELDCGEGYVVNSNVIGNAFIFDEENINQESGAFKLNNSKLTLLNSAVFGNKSKNSDGTLSPADFLADSKSKIKGSYNLITNSDILSSEKNSILNGDLADYVVCSPSNYLKLQDSDKLVINAGFELPIVVELPNKVRIVVIKNDVNFLVGTKTIFDYNDLDNIIVGFIENEGFELLDGKIKYEIKVNLTVAGGGKRPPSLIGNSLANPFLSDTFVSLTPLTTDSGMIPQLRLGVENIFSKGDRVSLTAVPSFGFEFEEWKLDGLNNEAELDLSSQTISLTANGNISIKPIFKSTNDDNISVCVVSDSNANFISVDQADGSFKLSPNSLPKENDKVLCGFNSKPDGTGECYLLGKTYKASTNLILYAVWCQNGYGYIAGHTEPNACVSVYGRDDFYLGGATTRANGDYIVKDIIPSYDERITIKSSDKQVIFSDLMSISPVYSSGENFEDVDDEMDIEIDELVSNNDEAENQDAPEIIEEEQKDDSSKPNEDNEDSLNIAQPTAESVSRQLATIKKYHIDYSWLPDIRANVNRVSNLKNSYEHLSEDERQLLSENEEIEIQNYIKALEKVK